MKFYFDQMSITIDLAMTRSIYSTFEYMFDCFGLYLSKSVMNFELEVLNSFWIYPSSLHKENIITVVLDRSSIFDLKRLDAEYVVQLKQQRTNQPTFKRKCPNRATKFRTFTKQ